MLTLLFEAFVALVVEETVRRFIPRYLRQAWMVIICILTWELLNSPIVQDTVLTEIYAKFGIRHRVVSTVLVGIVGALVFVLYWLGIGRIFRKSQTPEHAIPSVSAPTPGSGGGGARGGERPLGKKETRTEQKQPPVVTGTISTPTARPQHEEAEHPGVQSSLSEPPTGRARQNAENGLQPPVLIETAPSFGNIKERAVALSEEIMEDLYMHGWREGDPRLPHAMPLVEHMKIPPAASLEQMADWNRRRSDKFRFRFFSRALEIRNEFAQLHIRDQRLDEFFEREEMVAQANRQLAAAGQQRQIDVILPQEIADIAERLRALAGQIPRGAPRALNYTQHDRTGEVASVPPSQNAVANADHFGGTNLFPFKVVITIDVEEPISAGYIVVEFDSRFAMASADLPGGQLAIGNEASAPKQLRDYLASRQGTSYALALGGTPLRPGTPLRVFASGKKPFHATKVTLFEE